MNVSVTLFVNAGMLVTVDGTSFLVDVFHNIETILFSSVKPEQYEKILSVPEVSDAGLLIYTHFHPDHYSRKMTEDFLTAHPDVTVLGPVPSCDPSVPFTADEIDHEYGGLRFRFYRTPHEGRRFSETALYSFTVEKDGVLLYFGADGEVASPKIAEILNGRRPDLAILNFPWVATSKGREFVENEMRPKHVFIVHVPFPEDDKRFHYREGTFRGLSQCAIADVRVFTEFLQKEEVEL